MTIAEIRSWWNSKTWVWRRSKLSPQPRRSDSLNFTALSQTEMRDVFLLYASLQRPRRAR